MSARRPIEVVGGGVAGLALGLALRRAGVPVTVYEAGDFPRHRVCGEFISGLDDGTREALGLDPFLADAVPHRSVTYAVRGRKLPPFGLPAVAWGISRHTLDARLAEAFEAAGGILRRRTRVAEDPAPEGRVFAAGRRREGPFWVGLKVHARGLPLASDFEVHLGDHAYVGLSRVEDGAVNVCGLFAPRAGGGTGVPLLLATLRSAGLGVLAGRLEASALEAASFCTCAAPLGDRRVAPADRLVLGDACATIPPFTGNGLAMALQGAEAALAPLRAYAEGRESWAGTRRAVAGRQRRRFRRRLLVASLLHPFLLARGGQAVLSGLARARLLPFRTLYGVLH